MKIEALEGFPYKDVYDHMPFIYHKSGEIFVVEIFS